MSAFSNNDFLNNTDEFLTDEGTRFSRYVDESDIIIAVSGSVGKCSMLKISGYIYDGLMVVKSIKNETNRRHLFLFFKALQASLLTQAIGSTWKNINTDLANNLVIPLPPLAEQQAIVARVDSLMATIDALEAQVTERKEQAQQLMQAVLREAFAG